MKATVMDMRRHPKRIVDAVIRNERVRLSVRGREIAEIVPVKGAEPRQAIADHPAVGMWADRGDMADPLAHVRNLRKGRFDAL